METNGVRDISNLLKEGCESKEKGCEFSNPLLIFVSEYIMLNVPDSRALRHS